MTSISKTNSEGSETSLKNDTPELVTFSYNILFHHILVLVTHVREQANILIVVHFPQMEGEEVLIIVRLPSQADLKDEQRFVHWHLNLLKAYTMHQRSD